LKHYRMSAVKTQNWRQRREASDAGAFNSSQPVESWTCHWREISDIKRFTTGSWHYRHHEVMCWVLSYQSASSIC